MDVPTWLWLVTIGGILGVIIVDLLVVDSRPHVFTTADATRWVLFYVAAAVLFGVGLLIFVSPSIAGEFYAGYITEYSLSVDNLFVFIVIMSAFAVPQVLQHRVLLIGVLIALFLRGIMIAVGAAAIERFTVTFYFFGALLLFTAVQLVRGHGVDPDPASNPVVKIVERYLPTTSDYHGSRLVVRVGGRRLLTPMLLVMVAIGTTDVLFALDSIPAIFGLTHNAYLVFTANAFALMGLRQLYFLVNGLLDRLVYLPLGLAVILGFIGGKLILEAIHATSNLPVPTIPIWGSLAFIILVLALTTVASLWRARRDPSMVSGSARRGHEQALRRSGRGLEELPPTRGVGNESGEESRGDD
ncbi:MAG: TerC family protein [Candidatus Nanopelagicales bacterium]|nr:TerC family protein [Candidatus Nanopelagicales bacterium]